MIDREEEMRRRMAEAEARLEAAHRRIEDKMRRAHERVEAALDRARRNVDEIERRRASRGDPRRGFWQGGRWWSWRRRPEDGEPVPPPEPKPSPLSGGAEAPLD